MPKELTNTAERVRVLAREQLMYDTLKRIATAYQSPEKLRAVAAKKYGLEPEEVIEMAYENVKAEAAAAIKGVRRPK